MITRYSSFMFLILACLVGGGALYYYFLPKHAAETLSTITVIKNKEDFDEILKNSTKPIAAQFHSGCAVCEATGQHFVELASMYPAMRFVDIDINDVPNLSEKFAIAALPTVLIFEPGKETPIHSITGASKEELEAKLKDTLSK